jgi:hypothetical protein
VEVVVDFKRHPLVEGFGRELVERVYNDLLRNELRAWSGQSPRADRLHQRLEETGLSAEQRRLIWRLLSSAVENAYHSVVQYVDDKVSSREMTIRFVDPDAPATNMPWDTETIGMPYGFSADMLDAFGVDSQKILTESLPWPAETPKPRQADPRAEATKDWLEKLVEAEGRCQECGRPPAALRRTCGTCGQAY